MKRLIVLAVIVIVTYVASWAIFDYLRSEPKGEEQ